MPVLDVVHWPDNIFERKNLSSEISQPVSPVSSFESVMFRLGVIPDTRCTTTKYTAFDRIVEPDGAANVLCPTVRLAGLVKSNTLAFGRRLLELSRYESHNDTDITVSLGADLKSSVTEVRS